jgi:hypothetical protein
LILYACGEEKSRITTNNISILNWDQIIKAKKGVRARDKMLCGNVIAEYNENIIEIHLNIPYSMLSRFDF